MTAGKSGGAPNSNTPKPPPWVRPGKLWDEPYLPYVKDALKYVPKKYQAPANEKLVLDHLTETLRIIRTVSADLGTAKAQHWAGMPPHERREQFAKAAAHIEKAAKILDVLRQPRRRHMADRSVPVIHPEGTAEFRRAMANRLAAALSDEYIEGFGLYSQQEPQYEEAVSAVNARLRAHVIGKRAEEMAIDILNRLAQGFRDAEDALKGRAGPRTRVPPRDILLVNFIFLWQRIHHSWPDGRVTYSGGETLFFEFCRDLADAVGGRYLCTQTHLADAVRMYNELIGPEPDPGDPRLDDFDVITDDELETGDGARSDDPGSAP